MVYVATYPLVSNTAASDGSHGLMQTMAILYWIVFVRAIVRADAR